MKKMKLTLALGAAALSVCAFGFDIQSAVDAAVRRGGGDVVIPAGDHETGTVKLGSNVRVVVSKGARVRAKRDKSAYLPGQATAVFYAEAATNVTVCGEGVVDGQGGAFGFADTSEPEGRPRLVCFRSCRDVRVEDVTLKDPGFWTVYFHECDGVVVRRVTIRSHANFNNDGLDFQAKNVLVEDCDLVCDDDAIVFKGENPDFVIENVTVRRCRISTNCNAFKFGTASLGTVRNVTISDCEVCPRRDSLMWDWTTRVPGCRTHDCGISAVALEVVDGGRMEKVRVRDVTVDGMMVPFFVRLGRRTPAKPGRETYLRDILVERISGKAVSRLASSVTGVPGLRPSDIVFRDISFSLPGGGTAAEAKDVVPECETKYPECYMFDWKALPAYGFYVRHADRVTFENVRFHLRNPDARPAYVFDDAVRDVR